VCSRLILLPIRQRPLANPNCSDPGKDWEHRDPFLELSGIDALAGKSACAGLVTSSGSLQLLKSRLHQVVSC
jgi:hypothetical protein